MPRLEAYGLEKRAVARVLPRTTYLGKRGETGAVREVTEDGVEQLWRYANEVVEFCAGPDLAYVDWHGGRWARGESCRRPRGKVGIERA